MVGLLWVMMMNWLAGSSREHQLPARLRHVAAEVAGGFDPFGGNLLDRFERGPLGRAVGYAAGEFGDFGDEGLIGFAPVDDDFVLH